MNNNKIEVQGLTEIKNVRQHQSEDFRRWFSDDYFDLIIWLDNNNQISGFQLCYDKLSFERVLTWKKDSGYSHEKIDGGEQNATINRTPILVPDGICQTDNLIKMFEKHSSSLEDNIRGFVLNKLQQYKAT